MNGVGFEILARRPVPQLPLSYPPPPYPETRPRMRIRRSSDIEYNVSCDSEHRQQMAIIAKKNIYIYISACI